MAGPDSGAANAARGLDANSLSDSSMMTRPSSRGRGDEPVDLVAGERTPFRHAGRGDEQDPGAPPPAPSIAVDVGDRAAVAPPR